MKKINHIFSMLFFISMLIWLCNSAYDNLNNEITFYRMSCFDKESNKQLELINCAPKNKFFYKLNYKIFAENQTVINWNGVISEKYKKCVVKDRNNFVCKSGKDWDVLVENGNEIIPPKEKEVMSVGWPAEKLNQIILLF